MSSDDRFWNRGELYKQFWSVPMWSLAKRYGISDVGLAKVYRKPTVPVPGPRLLGKKQAGQEVYQEPLPQIKEKNKILFQKPSPAEGATCERRIVDR